MHLVAESTAITETVIAAVGLLMLTAGLAYSHVLARARREGGLSEADSRHYQALDRRRGLGLGIMASMALIMLATTLINTRVDRSNARLYIILWMAVVGLVCWLLWLALLDWRANYRYAARHRRALADEQRSYFAELARRRREREMHQGPGPFDPSWN